jgi:hypothetical protein
MIYEAPEVFELGNAEELTLGGNCGWWLDEWGWPRTDCQEPPWWASENQEE